MLTVKVLGPGCANCKRLEQMTRRAVEALGVDAEIKKVTDYGEIMGYGVMATPGLVINDRVVVNGRLPSPDEVSTWLADALATAA